MEDWRKFTLKKGGKTLVWKIANMGESYKTEHGQLNGAMQTFSDLPGPKGKPGTKAYVSAADNCKFNVLREIRKKQEHGYVEIGADGKPLTTQINSISWDEILPKNFCSFKPKTDIDTKALEKLHKSGKARYTRKYDGQCVLAVHHTSGWEFYSRRMDLMTEKLPLHILELCEMSTFDVGTVLVGELLCLDKNGKDDFKSISRFCRSLPEESRNLVDNGEVPEPQFLIFDCLFHNGKDLKNESYDKRSLLWKKLSGKLVKSVKYFDVTPATWQKTAKDNGWEGFVVTDGSCTPGDKFYSFDGDAKRPNGHHKLKPVYEEDVVIFATSKGSGKRIDTIGAVHIMQRHPDTGKWFYCGKVGSGFTDDDLVEVEKLCKEKSLPSFEKDKEAESLELNGSGIVCQIEYGERQLGTQKFRFPVFIRLRNDKDESECFAARLANEE